MQRLTKMVSFNRRGSGLNSQNEINVEDSEDAHYFSPERNEEIEVEENISNNNEKEDHQTGGLRSMFKRLGSHRASSSSSSWATNVNAPARPSHSPHSSKGGAFPHPAFKTPLERYQSQSVDTSLGGASDDFPPAASRRFGRSSSHQTREETQKKESQKFEAKLSTIASFGRASLEEQNTAATNLTSQSSGAVEIPSSTMLLPSTTPPRPSMPPPPHPSPNSIKILQLQMELEALKERERESNGSRPSQSPDPNTTTPLKKNNSSALSLITLPNGPDMGKITPLTIEKTNNAKELVKINGPSGASPSTSASLGMRPGTSQRQDMATTNLDSARFMSWSEARNSEPAPPVEEDPPPSNLTHAGRNCPPASTLATLPESGEHALEANSDSLQSLAKLVEAISQPQVQVQPQHTFEKKKKVQLMDRLRGMFGSGQDSMTKVPSATQLQSLNLSTESQGRTSDMGSERLFSLEKPHDARPPAIPTAPSADQELKEEPQLNNNPLLSLISRMHRSNDAKPEAGSGPLPAPPIIKKARRASSVVFSDPPAPLVPSEAVVQASGASGRWRSALETLARRSLTPLMPGPSGSPRSPVLSKMSPQGVARKKSGSEASSLRRLALGARSAPPEEDEFDDDDDNNIGLTIQTPEPLFDQGLVIAPPPLPVASSSRVNTSERLASSHVSSVREASLRDAEASLRERTPSVTPLTDQGLMDSIPNSLALLHMSHSELVSANSADSSCKMNKEGILPEDLPSSVNILLSKLALLPPRIRTGIQKQFGIESVESSPPPPSPPQACPSPSHPPSSSKPTDFQDETRDDIILHGPSSESDVQKLIALKRELEALQEAKARKYAELSRVHIEQNTTNTEQVGGMLESQPYIDTIFIPPHPTNHKKQEVEEKRQAEEAALAAEVKRQAGKASLAAEVQRQAEEAALAAELKRQAEEASLASEVKRQAEEAALASVVKRQAEEDALAAEVKRQVEEAALASEVKRQAEEAALAAEVKRQAEEAALAAEVKRQAEEASLAAEVQRQAEEAALAAEVKRRAEEASLAAEVQRQAEEDALAAEVKRQAEEASFAAEVKRQAEEAALAAEVKRQAEEAALAAELKRQAEEASLAAELKRQAEEASLAAEVQRQAEEAALAAEVKRQAEEASFAAEVQRQVEVDALAAELKRQAEEASLASGVPRQAEEASFAAEVKCQAEEASLAAEVKRQAEEASLAAEVKRQAEEAAFVAECPRQAEEASFAAEEIAFLEKRQEAEVALVALEMRKSMAEVALLSLEQRRIEAEERLSVLSSEKKRLMKSVSSEQPLDVASSLPPILTSSSATGFMTPSTSRPLTSNRGHHHEALLASGSNIGSDSPSRQIWQRIASFPSPLTSSPAYEAFVLTPSSNRGSPSSSRAVDDPPPVTGVGRQGTPPVRGLLRAQITAVNQQGEIVTLPATIILDPGSMKRMTQSPPGGSGQKAKWVVSSFPLNIDEEEY